MQATLKKLRRGGHRFRVVESPKTMRRMDPKEGISAIQSAYNQQKKAVEDRAKRRMVVAKTKYERERIKAELEMEKLQLQREMYEAKAAVERGREAVARARTAAQRKGGSGIGKFISGTGKSFRQLQRGLYGPLPRKRKTVVKKRTVARR